MDRVPATGVRRPPSWSTWSVFSASGPSPHHLCIISRCQRSKDDSHSSCDRAQPLLLRIPGSSTAKPSLWKQSSALRSASPSGCPATDQRRVDEERGELCARPVAPVVGGGPSGVQHSARCIVLIQSRPRSCAILGLVSLVRHQLSSSTSTHARPTAPGAGTRYRNSTVSCRLSSTDLPQPEPGRHGCKGGRTGEPAPWPHTLPLHGRMEQPSPPGGLVCGEPLQQRHPRQTHLYRTSTYAPPRTGAALVR